MSGAGKAKERGTTPTTLYGRELSCSGAPTASRGPANNGPASRSLMTTDGA